jgi:hypothetical protein
MREYGKSRFFAIIVAHFNFSCTLLATFGANSKKANLEETSMKIAARLLVLTLVLSAVGVAQSSSFGGPGPEPAPPVGLTY